MKVVNLITEEEMIYSLDNAEEAVILAFIQKTFSDFNIDEYEKQFSKLYSRLVFGKYTVACGDWCAVR